MEIKIPSNITRMRIKHLPFLTRLAELGEKEYSIREIREMNASFLQVPFEEFPPYRPKDDIKIFNTICKAVNTKSKADTEQFVAHDGKVYNEPPKELNYNGLTYTFRNDFTKLPTSWFMDIDIAFEMHGEAFEGKPELMAGFCYVEKGLSYGQKDDSGLVVNSVVERSKVFKEYMPLNEFLDLQGFFLWRWNVLHPLLTEVRAKRKKAQRERKLNGNGKNQLTH